MKCAVIRTVLSHFGHTWKMYCEMQLLRLLDFSSTVSLFLVILTLFFKLLVKYLKITHNTCWHIFTRPPIGFTPSECFISCEMCSDKISLKLGMAIMLPMSFTVAYRKQRRPGSLLPEQCIQ